LDRKQVFIENLCEAAITLIYLLEEVDRALFLMYPLHYTQARYLLIDVEEELQKFPNHPELLL